MEQDEGRSVARRRVFYIPGYDPYHPRRYWELYRQEGQAQAGIAGYELQTSPKRGSRPFGWTVTARMDGRQTATDISILVWSDIVRDSMGAGILGTYAQLARTAWVYAASGALWRLMGLRKGPVIAAFYPVVMLLLQLGLAVGLGILAGWAAGAGLAAAGLEDRLLLRLAGLAVAAGVLAGVLRWFRRRDARLFAYYLMHDYAFSARWRGANPPALEQRLAEFRRAVASAVREGDADEVLLVGHSSGAHLAVSVMADLVRSGELPQDGPALGLLTLGHVIPMMSFLPDAQRLRADLACLAACDRLAWVDVSAPGDGCAFALCDPVAVSGVRPAEARWPLVISAAFTRTLAPETWKRLRWRFFRLHFQYLCAFDRPGDYDYFRITAGPRTLRDRFAGRPPSRSRIVRAASPHRSVAA
jgi:hypothetical protein